MEAPEFFLNDSLQPKAGFLRIWVLTIGAKFFKLGLKFWVGGGFLGEKSEKPPHLTGSNSANKRAFFDPSASLERF